MWSAIGVAASFLVIIILVARKFPLGYALLVGSFIAAISAGLGPWGFLTATGQALILPATLNLVSNLVLISILGGLMKNLGILDKMVEALETVLRSAKLTIMIIPSILGSLSITGGAVMAAPMVDSMGERINLSNERRAAVNLLYRHAWYFIFPFTPSFILIKEITNLDIKSLMLIQLPLTVAAVSTGYYAWLRDIKEDRNGMPAPTGEDYRNMLRYTSPILVSLILGLGFGAPFQAALLVGIALAFYFGKANFKDIPALILKGVQIPLIVSGVGIMIFAEILNRGGTMGVITDSLLNLGLPLGVVVVVLPALTAFVSGSSSSGVGITLPLLLSAIMQSPYIPLYVAVVHASSFLGYYTSPLHLCQVLTLEFFKVKMNDLYREYLLPFAALWGTLILIVTLGHFINL